MIWFRGEVVPDEAVRISALDRTFEHGLGLFETFRTWNGRPTLLPRHLERMRRSARELGLVLDPADLPDDRAVTQLIAEAARTAPRPLEDSPVADRAFRWPGGRRAGNRRHPPSG